jgi:hypothetical protein
MAHPIGYQYVRIGPELYRYSLKMERWTYLQRESQLDVGHRRWIRGPTIFRSGPGTRDRRHLIKPIRVLLIPSILCHDIFDISRNLVGLLEAEVSVVPKHTSRDALKRKMDSFTM